MEEYEYRVIWAIKVGATSHLDAAKEALKIMQDPDSEAQSFEVRKMKDIGTVKNRTEHIDLLEE